MPKPKEANPSAAVLAVIPARVGSTRLPHKPLLQIAGAPLIAHVVRCVRRCPSVSDVLVATDDARIAAVAVREKARSWLSDGHYATGTDRVAAALAAEQSAGRHWPWILNVQGDEPQIAAEDLQTLIAGMLAAPGEMGTLVHPFPASDEETARDASVVKVVLDRRGYALYFSRAMLPYVRADSAPEADFFWRHVGVYLYRADFLAHFASLPATPLSSLEQLEQLRALEHGYRIRCFTARHGSVGVDTPADLAHLRRVMASETERLSLQRDGETP